MKKNKMKVYVSVIILMFFFKLSVVSQTDNVLKNNSNYYDELYN